MKKRILLTVLIFAVMMIGLAITASAAVDDLDAEINFFTETLIIGDSDDDYALIPGVEYRIVTTPLIKGATLSSDPKHDEAKTKYGAWTEYAGEIALAKIIPNPKKAEQVGLMQKVVIEYQVLTASGYVGDEIVIPERTFLNTAKVPIKDTEFKTKAGGTVLGAGEEIWYKAQAAATWLPYDGTNHVKVTNPSKLVFRIGTMETGKYTKFFSTASKAVALKGSAKAPGAKYDIKTDTITGVKKDMRWSLTGVGANKGAADEDYADNAAAIAAGWKFVGDVKALTRAVIDEAIIAAGGNAGDAATVYIQVKGKDNSWSRTAVVKLDGAGDAPDISLDGGVDGGLVFDYVFETIKKVSDKMEYSLNGGTTWVAIKDTNDVVLTAVIDKIKVGDIGNVDSLLVRYKYVKAATGVTEKAPSASAKFDITSVRADASGITYTGGTFAHATKTLQYYDTTAKKWVANAPVAQTTKNVKYKVRYAGVEDPSASPDPIYDLPSKAVEVEVPKSSGAAATQGDVNVNVTSAGAAGGGGTHWKLTVVIASGDGKFKSAATIGDFVISLNGTAINMTGASVAYTNSDKTATITLTNTGIIETSGYTLKIDKGAFTDDGVVATANVTATSGN